MVQNFKDSFDIPIVLFTFLRTEQPLQIIQRLRDIKPSKVFLFSDGPRNEKEKKIVDDARSTLYRAIDWKCQLICRFSDVNQGVYNQIALGAKSVFETEAQAIFLEDDNLPEITFFPYCKEMLKKFENNDQVFWICGTNYLGKYDPPDGSSYLFSHHTFPCGWASWSSKFLKYYDDCLVSIFDKKKQKIIKNGYPNKALYRQQLSRQRGERYRFESGIRFVSWDHQMTLTIRSNNFFGIVPSINQIKNIGVDKLSTHGGSSFRMKMTMKLCGMDSSRLTFPLVHPKKVDVDPAFEKKTAKIILEPFFARTKYYLAMGIKKVFGLNPYVRFRDLKREK